MFKPPPNEALTPEHERTIAFPGWGKGDRLRWMRSLRSDIASPSTEAQTNVNIVPIPTKTYSHQPLNEVKRLFNDLIRLLSDIP